MSSVFSRRRVMRAVGCGVVALGGASATVAGQEESRESAANKAHCEWLAAMIRQTEAIRVGMTRSEVEKTFDLDFPARHWTSGRYQLRHCSYIKLDLAFKEDDEHLGERSRDKITERSMPLLDLVPNRLRF